MRNAGLKDNSVRSVCVDYCYDLRPDLVLKKTFRSMREYNNWCVSSEAQRYHIIKLHIEYAYDTSFEILSVLPEFSGSLFE